MYDVVIIGAGPAGMTAGVYAAKNKLKALVVAKIIPEHSSDSLGLLSYENLKKEFENEIKTNGEFLELQSGREVVSLEKNVVSFSVEIKSGGLYYCKCVIVAIGGAETIFDLITYKEQGKIKVDSGMKTNIPGIFAAGDVTASSIQDVLVSAGQGAQAALSALRFLKQNP
jgi:thioredoxin reductase (NADPH)